MQHRLAIAAGVTSLALLAGGCGIGPDLYDVPLPSKISGPTYELRADFESALNLPVASPVKLEGKTVGVVSSVTTSDYIAHVTLNITEGTELPEGTRAEVRLTAPVGESFVALRTPDEPTAALLTAGDTLGLDVTATAPDTTDLLTGVSTAVTGGNYADLKVIVDELVVAMDGTSTTARHLLRQVDTLVTSTNEHRDDIDRALDALDRLSSQLAAQTDSISTSVTKLDPAIRALQQQEDKAVALLQALDRVEHKSSGVIAGLEGRLKSQLDATQEVVDAVIARKDDLRTMMTGVSAFAVALERATPGDFAMFDLTANGIPALPELGAVQITPDAGTLLQDDPAAIIGGLTDTLIGKDGLLGLLTGIASAGGDH